MYFVGDGMGWRVDDGWRWRRGWIRGAFGIEMIGRERERARNWGF